MKSLILASILTITTSTTAFAGTLSNEHKKVVLDFTTSRALYCVNTVKNLESDIDDCINAARFEFASIIEGNPTASDFMAQYDEYMNINIDILLETIFGE